MHINGLTLLGGAASNFVVWPPTPRGAWGACLPTPCPRTPARVPNPPVRPQAAMTNLYPTKLNLEPSPV